MNSDFLPSSVAARCLDCACPLERRAFGEWWMQQCPQCGGVWMNGDVIHQMSLNLHLRHLDSERAVREVGALLLRTINSISEPAKSRPVVLTPVSPHAVDARKGDTV